MPPISKKEVLNDDVKLAFEALNKVIADTVKLIETLTSESSALSAALKGSNLTQLVQTEAQYNEVLKTNNQLKKEILALEQKRLQLEVSEARAKSDLIGAENKLNKELEKRQKLADANLKKQAQQTSLYAQESAALTKLRNETKDLAIQIQQTTAKFGAESTEVKRLTVEYDRNAASVVKMDKNLRTIDAKLGQYGRNVGNYTNQNYGLNTAFNQITRELPVLGMNLNTFFLAISNNIPMFADEIQKLTLANKALREEGQAAPPVWKSMVKAIFSWQTALSIGVALLVMYGKNLVDWIGKLFKSSDAISMATKRQEQFNDIQKETSKNAAEEISTLNLLTNAATNHTKKLDDRLKAVKKLKDEWPEYYGNLSDEYIMAGNATEQYRKLAQSIINAAKAEAYKAKITANQQRIIEIDDEVDAEYKLLQGIQDKIKYQEEFNKIQANEAAVFSQAEVARVNKRQEDASTAKIMALNNEKQMLSELNDEYANSTGVLDLYAEKNDKANKSGKVDELPFVDTSKAMDELRQKYDDFGKEKDTLWELSKESWKGMMDSDVSEADRALKEELELIKEANELKLDLEEELQQRKYEIQRSALQLTEDISVGYFEASIQRLRDESDLISEEYDRRLDNEMLSDEQRKALEKQRDAEIRANEKKQRELEKKQFLVEQGFKIASIWMDTNEKVAMATNNANLIASMPFPLNLQAPRAYAQIPLIKLNGALGVASVLAQTIPQLDKGSFYTPETYIGGEKGTEIHIDKAGKASLITQPTLFTNDAGSKVIGRKDTSKILENAKNNMILSGIKRSNDENIQLLHALNKINRSIDKQRGNQIKILNKSDVSLMAYKQKLRNG